MQAFIDTFRSAWSAIPTKSGWRSRIAPGVQAYRLNLGPGDAGKIIGRRGTTIQAIRSLVQVGAQRRASGARRPRGRMRSRPARADRTAPLPMKIDVLTLFPAMFAGPLDESIIRRARTRGSLDLRIHNLRGVDA